MPQVSHYGIKRFPDNLAVPEHWVRRAACRESFDLFHPEGSAVEVYEKTEAAKAICRTCPVIRDCRAHALKRGEAFGIWGGLDERERRTILLRAARLAKVRAEAEAAEEAADGAEAQTAA